MRTYKVRRGLRWVHVVTPQGVMVADVRGDGERLHDGSDPVIGVLVVGVCTDQSPSTTFTFIPGTSVDQMLGEEEERSCCERGDPPCGKDDCEEHPKDDP